MRYHGVTTRVCTILLAVVLLSGCVSPPYPGLLYDLAHEPVVLNNCPEKARRYHDCLTVLGVASFIRGADDHATVVIVEPGGRVLCSDPTTGRVWVLSKQGAQQ